MDRVPFNFFIFSAFPFILSNYVTADLLDLNSKSSLTLAPVKTGNEIIDDVVDLIPRVNISIGLGGADEKIAPYITPCSLSDPGFESCAKSVANKILDHCTTQGDEALGIPKIAGFAAPLVIISNDNFLIKEENYTAYGFEKTRVTQLTKLPFQNKIVTTLRAGQVLSVTNISFDAIIKDEHILASGYGTITLPDVYFYYNFTWTPALNGTFKYVKILDQEYDWNPGRLFYNITFAGVDKARGDEINQHINDNAEEVFQKSGPSLMDVVRALFGSYVNPLFSKIPYDRFFLI